MEFKVISMEKSKSFIVRQEGKVYATAQFSKEIFEYMRSNYNESDWKIYLKRNDTTLIK